MMTDILDTVRAALETHDAGECVCGWEDFCFEYFAGHDDDRAWAIRALVAEVESLRQRHAEAASRICCTCAAWNGPDRDGYGWCKILEHAEASDFFCAAWLASEAKARLT